MTSVSSMCIMSTALDLPCTATQFARLSTFILHTPRKALHALFDPKFPSTVESLNPSVPSPDVLTLHTCVRLFSMMRVNSHMSSSTVPLTLALLLRYRLMPSRATLTCDDEYIVAASFLLAHKFQDDTGTPFAFVARSLGLGVPTLKGAEKELLEALEWGVWVGGDALREVEGILGEVSKLYG
ncbi:hypothetical protein HBH53_199540 [Parastagonospora nodorum]|nr:hypothetical protein HBH53_199540 [Parastagonospora nodorum]KAH5351195.1 hypothetical protein HBI49_185600 [Parastagonospora nodorum]KAH5397791.1 hypothetical protein HBI32_192000 [Parastagonospora nodorum]KAH5492636.1 hypothetical protein HBI52_213170 [Parastagonospora nodorum]